MQDQYIKGSGGSIASYQSVGSGSWGANGDTISWDPTQETPFNKNGQLIGNITGDTITGLIPFKPFDNMNTFFKTGRTWENNLALSGGSDISSYRFSFSSLKQDGIVPLADFKRYTTKMSGQTKLSDKLSASGSATYSNSGGRRVQQGSNLSGLMLDLLRTPISFDNSNDVGEGVYDDPSSYILADGRQRNYRGGGGYDNPYWTINQCPFNDKVNRVYGFGQVDYLPASWQNLTYRLGTDNYSEYKKQFFAIGSRAFPGGQIFVSQFNYFHVNSDVIATATKKFSDDLDGSLTLGQNMYSQRTKSIYTQGDDLVFTDFQNLIIIKIIFRSN